MSAGFTPSRPLRGGCQCGRNSYQIDLPLEDGASLAQVLFDTDPRHRIFQASPLAAFIRVPLAWYRSSTLPFFPDETSAAIRRTYTHPNQQATKRGFCGFCGTPLSYWSEEPPSEAAFIRLTLGSLCSEDLGDLEYMGLLPGSEELTHSSTSAATPATRWAAVLGEPEETARGGGGGSSSSAPVVGRETLGTPWFDSLVAGSRLGNMRQSRGGGQSRDGRVTYEWEVVEWTNGDEGMAAEEEEDRRRTGDSPSKRLKHDDDGGAMEH